MDKTMKKTQNSVKKQNVQKEIEQKITELAQKIDQVEDEKLELTNQLKRALADYQNLETHTQKRLSLMYMQSRKSLAEKLIPVVDDLTVALKAKQEIQFEGQQKSWTDGVEALLNNFEKSLNEIGLKKYIPEKNSTFDVNQHEAITTIPGEEDGLIYDVIQPGYILDDTVIRPSRVVVTKK